ncbi:Fic/DOC family N-terminal domain-containing protein, partial [Nocardia sp. NPDC058497]|uniref:Fic/DOC family N-terminal domain-containing protein n=1 Tax=Nocardia sp. NPDC058497 TaxID=3346529 RepID=UPI0036649C37
MTNDPAGWPAVRYEQHPWVVRDTYVSRTQLRRHAGPYSAAVLSDIAEQSVALPVGLLAEADEAAQELVRFDAHLSAELGPDELGPMSSVLLRTESSASSQIENLTVGARQLAMAELGEHTNRNARIVTANVRAMEAALDLGRAVDADSILAMHRALLGESDPTQAVRLRDQQVCLGGRNLGPHLADLVTPHHDLFHNAIA